jgi:hypothetical protein
LYQRYRRRRCIGRTIRSPRTLASEAIVDGLWRGLADLVVGLHYGYMALLVAGGFIAWRWPKVIWAHVVVVAWAVLIVTTHIPCPLTALQNHLRETAGQQPLSNSFINLYIRGTFYPDGQQALAQAVIGLVVIASWVGFARLRRGRPAARLGSEQAGSLTV